MPVVLDEADWNTWLDTSETLTRNVLELLVPASDNLLDAVPVSRRVNAVANDDASVQEEVDPQENSEPEAPEPEKKPDPQMSLF